MDNRTGSALSTNERPSREAKFLLIGLSAIFGMTPKPQRSQVIPIERAGERTKSPPKFRGKAVSLLLAQWSFPGARCKLSRGQRVWGELTGPYPISPILYKLRHRMKFNRVEKIMKTGAGERAQSPG